MSALPPQRARGTVGGSVAFYAITAAFLIAIHAMVWQFSDESIAHRSLRGTDPYMWLNRVLYWADGAGWWDHVYPRINPPSGLLQHWTRPFEMLLAWGGRLTGLVVGDFRSGLYYFSVAVPPLLHLAAVVVVAWLGRTLVRAKQFSVDQAPLLFLVFLAQVPVYQPFLAGRPDHHAPLALLFLLHVVLLILLILAPKDDGRGARAAFGLGLVNALALWVNPGAMVYIVIGMGTLLALWIWTGEGGVSRRNAIYGTSIALGVTAACTIEWGPAVLDERRMDVLTYPHAILMLLVAAFWLAMHAVSRLGWADRTAQRGAIGVIGGLATVLGAVLAAPEFVSNPLGVMDPLFESTFMEHVNELQPLAALGNGLLGHAGHVILYAGSPGIALAFLLISRDPTRTVRVRILRAALAALVVTYLVLSLHQVRWIDHLGISTVLPMTLLMTHVLRAMPSGPGGMGRRLARNAVILALLTGTTVLGQGAIALSPGPTSSDQAAVLERQWREAVAAGQDSDDTHCDLVEISRHLSDRKAFPEAKIVMAHTDYGSELLFRTHHAVLSIPHHRPQPGYRLTYGILGNPEFEAASTALQESKVGILLVCLSDITSGFYARALDAGEPFVNLIGRGRVPDGFEIHVTGPNFRIFTRAPEPPTPYRPSFPN